MNRLIKYGLVVAASFAVVACQTGGGSADSNDTTVKVSPNDQRDYAAMTLDNGIGVILVSDPTVDKSAAALSVGVGLLHDPMTQQGMAHYLEHMLFLGTERFPETNGYSDFMSKNGGSSNAYTWLDITNYMFEINNAAYDEALDRFSDFFKAPKLYEEYTEKEKNAVNAEWSMRREMDFFGQFKLNRSMMGDHPANRFLIGNLETLSDKPGSKLHTETVDFYNQYYSANIMKVALVSNLPLAQMKELATKHFSSIKDKAIEKPKVSTKLNFDEMGKKRIHYVPNQDVKQLVIDFTIDNNVDDYKTKPNFFISYLIGSEMPGSPAYELKKAGLISNLSSSGSPEQYGNYGSMAIRIDLTDAGMAKREEITAVVMNFIEKIRKDGVDKKYFKEIQTSLNNDFRFLEKGNAFGYVSNLADEMQTYPVTDVISAPYTYSRFDAKSIQNVLDQLTPERLRIWYISKQEPHDQTMHFYDGKYKIVDIPQSEIDAWSKPVNYALKLPKVNTLLPEGFDIKTADKADQAKPEMVHDENGIKVWHYPSQAFKTQPKGLVRVFFNSDEDMSDISSQILFSLWTDLYSLKQSALMTEADIAGMSLSLRERKGLELSVSGFTDKQAELLAQGLGSLVFDTDSKSFAQAVDRYIRNLKNAEKQFPISQLFGYMTNVVTATGYESDDLIKAAQKLTAEDLKSFMNKVMANNQIRVFAFGNYDDNDIKKFVGQIESVLPSDRQVTDYARTKIWKPASNEVISYKKDLEVADVAILDLIVHPDPSTKQEARARVLRSHLRTATFDKLRTEEQLAYAVTALTTQLRDYTTLGFAIQTPVKNVVDMQKRFDDFKTEYVEKLNAITDAEFTQLKNSVLVSLKEKPKNLSEELGPIIADWYEEKWDFSTRAKLIAEVEKVTLEDLKTFYKETALNPEASRVSIQLRGSKFKDGSFANLKGEKEVKNLVELHKAMQYQ
ncbi:peptidase M16 [Aliikangiella marina]|uniref:Protease 3 n=1 Tax=Aliikangiella marina TaxID=1712262 RepID=A0A545TDB1_9GAMM|nr:insulinase family protein [Aliikangiella marina]TQV75208.1 peptidase M16 [Aliikangiella marina]